MKKYLRMCTSDVDITKGARYEVIAESETVYSFIDDAGDGRSWSKSSRGNWFTLETEEDIAPIDGITVLPDESLGGLLREYREVKRKAAVGERLVFDANSPGITAGKTYVVMGGDRDGAEFIDDDGDKRWQAHIPANYSVLEPSEVIRIGSERFRMVDRKAAVGERVIIVNEGHESIGGQYYRIGNVGAMLGVGFSHGNIRVDFTGNDEYRGEGKWAVSAGDYRVLEPVKGEAETETQPLSSRPAMEQAAENIAALTTQIQTLEARLNALYDWHKRAAVDLRVAREDLVLIEEGVSGDIKALESRMAALEDRVMFELTGLTREKADEIGRIAKRIVAAKTPKSPQQIRDEIVERAKADVSEPYNFKGTPIAGEDLYFWPRGSSIVTHAVEYVVNPDKRTVAALIIKTYGGRKIVSRGVAKCAPNDVFNAHIGRAIALRRALGLEVPAEYLSVPAPTEIRVGDVVVWVTQGSIGGRVTAVDATGKAHVDVNWMTWVLVPSALKITDDTREGEFTSFAVKGVVA